MYLITNFKVLFYNGDETNRPVRTEKHIYFTSDTVMVKETVSGLKFPNYSFDMRNLEEMEVIKKDNRFLIGNTFISKLLTIFSSVLDI